jgi:hypothetical protein
VAGVDAFVSARVVDRHGSLDPGRVLGRRLAAVERHPGREVGAEPRRQHADHAAAIAEADRADLAGAVGPRANVIGAGDEVFAHLRLIQLGGQLARLLFVAGVAAKRRQRIGRNRHEVVEREAARNVFDVRVQAAVLVHHHDARELARGAGGTADIRLDLAVAVRGGRLAFPWGSPPRPPSIP